MNGRVMLADAGDPAGAAFRHAYPGRPFPLWLAKMLDYSGDGDPGFEHLWRDVRASIASGDLAVDVDGADAIGFLVHVIPLTDAMDVPADNGWFDHDHESRVPDVFPVGFDSEVPDRELRGCRERFIGYEPPEPERPIGDAIVSVIEVWPGDPLKRIDGGPVSLPVGELYLLHWMAALTADAPPRFELWVERKGQWAPPISTAGFVVKPKAASLTAIGPIPEASGWPVWWTSRDVAEALPHDTLEAAVAFTRGMALDGRMHVPAGAAREAFDSQAAIHSQDEGSFIWDGDVGRLAEPDERTILVLGGAVFRALTAFLILPGTVAFLVPWSLHPRGERFHVAGVPLLGGGAFLLLWCVRDFYVTGRGSLAPWAPPRRLVRVGLYRISRNPMYIAVVSILAAWALAFPSRTLWLYTVAVALGLHLRVVFGEEPWLARTHGDEWLAYRARVPRWLLPPRRSLPE